MRWRQDNQHDDHGNPCAPVSDLRRVWGIALGAGRRAEERRRSAVRRSGNVDDHNTSRCRSVTGCFQSGLVAKRPGKQAAPALLIRIRLEQEPAILRLSDEKGRSVALSVSPESAGMAVTMRPQGLPQCWASPSTDRTSSSWDENGKSLFHKAGLAGLPADADPGARPDRRRGARTGADAVKKQREEQ
jgi:hypothetical protein